MKSLAVVNLKGGSGKTTTALCLAVGLSRRGRRVLLIDADPQANASMTMLDGQPVEPPTLAHVLLDQADVEDAIRPTRLDRVDVLPADASLADAALMLADEMGRERRLREAMRSVEGRYDVVIADAAPQLNLVGINLLNYVEGLIVPVDAGVYSLAGLGRLQESVGQVRRFLDNKALRIAGLVLTRTHANRATKDIAGQLREAYGDLVYQTTIPHSVRVEEAHARNLTVLEFSPRSAPALAYNHLVTEVLSHGEPNERPGDSDPAIGPDASDADAA
jgi:chromosome partitioning protein